MSIRKVKHVTKKEDIEFLLNIKEEDITTSFIMETFAEFAGKSRFEPYDTLDIPANSYGPEGEKNKKPFITTVGIWVFNKYFIEKDLFHIFKYVNSTLNKKTFGAMNSKLSYALMEDDITLEQLKRFLMKSQKVMPYVSIFSPSQTMLMLTCTKPIEKKKKELLKKYEKEIKAGDEVAAENIQKELLKFAAELLQGDPSMDSYDSGSRGSFNNNFKNLFVMKGAVKDPDPDAKVPYNIATSNYMTGISKEEYALFANALSAGPYARAAKTAIGGYWEKLFLAAYQHVVLDKPDSDCKTNRYLDVDMSKQNISDYMYSYIVEGSQLIEITSKNMDKYSSKKVKIRFSSLCESKNGICSRCAGNMFYRLGILNIGMAIAIVASTLKNLAMKAFHDSNVNTVEMDPMEVFGIK